MITEMNHCEFLRKTRESLQLSVRVASLMTGVSEASYWDLETHDHELTSCLSVAEVFRICEVLRIHPLNLFDAKEMRATKITPQEIANKITDYCRSNKLTVSQFEDFAGWKVNEVIEQPASLLSAWDLECLRDICSQIGLDWLEVLSGLFQSGIRA